MRPIQHEVISTSRRTLVKSALGASLLAATPAGMWFAAAPARAQQSRTAAQAGEITTRTIAKTNEALPAIGLGTFLTFDTIPGQKRDHLREVIQRYWEGGVRVIDTSPLYGTAEITVGDYATSLGITDQMFVANKIWSTGDFLGDESHASQSLRLSEARLWRERIDLMQCHSLVNVDIVVPYLRAWKKEGRIRYVGVTHYENPYLEPLADWVERGNLDFVQVNYSIFDRRAEERVIRAAADRGTAVLTNMPFEKARLFKVVEGRPLPDFAKEFGAENWAQFFLKWVIANPAVTCALPATSKPDHAAENVGALRGPLPDAAMRARMVQHMESIPGFDRISEMPWYPDKRYPGIIGRAQSELRARS
jgi:diketogulonate reductase-like aldo/keto reductase